MNDNLERLIAKVVDAQRHLEQQVGGNFDVVVGASGETILSLFAQKRIVHDESEQRKYASERAAILDALPIHIAILDPSGRIAVVNKAWKDFAIDNGYSGEGDAIGQNYLDVCTRARGAEAEQAKEIARGIQSILSRHSNGFVVEYPCDAPSQRRWFEMLAAPMPQMTGFGAVIMHLNITSRKLAEEAWKASEAEFRNLAESMPQIVWVTRPDGWTTYFNHQWMTYTGLSLEESLGHGWNKPFHPLDQEAALGAWQNAVATAGSYSLECRLRRADGEYRWWLIRGVPLKDAHGAVLKWFGTCTDIHDIKEAQKRVSDQAMLLEKTRDAILVVDLESRIVYWNKGAEQLYGWTSEEVRGEPVEDRLYRDPDAFRNSISITLANGDWAGELEQYIKGGETVVVECRSTLVRDELGEPVSILSISTDVTQRRAVEEQLRQSQKMEAVGQLTGGIAHDFNNILFVILANSDALLEEENVSNAVTTRLDQIAEAVGRASALTRQLVAFSRKQTLHPQQTDLNDLVSDTGKLLRRALGAGIEIESILPEGLCVANIDRSQLETALVNLCINARDAMPDGGRLLIETRNVILDQDYVALNPDVKMGAYAMVSVTDTGTGIPPEALRKVFEPFFTTKEVGKGTGLGLSMVYGFIKQSGGHIKIYSEVGTGTTFKLYLPCSGEAAEQTSPPRNVSLPRGDERILVVEDEPQVRASIIQQLRSLGYAVSEAGDGQSGIAAFESAKGAYDLLLTDVVMPGPISGRLLVDEVKRRWPKTNVVFMSGFTELSAAHHGRLEEGALLLSKPFRKADLAQMVRQALDAEGSPDHVQPEAA
jgi:PAS domain S-box-containing protein